MTMYPYEDMIAFTPYDQQLAGGIGLVFALGDVNFETPLPTVDEHGNTVVLESNPETGYLPPFFVEDHTIVRFKSGDFTRTLSTVMPLPGPRGEVGDVGPLGPPPGLVPGEVQTAEPNAPATGTVEEVTDGVYKLNLSIPKGVKGDRGDVGPSSPEALAAAQAAQDAWAEAQAARVAAQATAGKSAYQIAVDNGFVGTELEWLASLPGASGAQMTDNGTTVTFG